MPILFYKLVLLWKRCRCILEYGKYSAILIMLINILRLGANKIKNKRDYLFYYVLYHHFIQLFDRTSISHAISGPFYLAIAIVFFSNQILNR